MSRYPTKDDFIRILNWIESNKDPLLFEVKTQSSQEAILGYLSCVLGADWVAQPPEFRVANIPNNREGTYFKVQTGVKQYLRHACDALHEPQAMDVTKRGDSYRLVWATRPSDQGSEKQGNGSFSRVFIVGNLRNSGEFDIDFMRGVHSMARELGIEIIDKRKLGWLEKSQLSGVSRPLAKLINDARLDADSDSILTRGHDHFEIVDQVEVARRLGFKVTTTGFGSGTISQNNAQLGHLLALKCIKDQETYGTQNWEGKHTICAIHCMGLPDTNTLAIQSHSFESTIEEDSRFLKTTIDFEVTHFRDERHWDRIYRTRLKAVLNEADISEISIFVPTERHYFALVRNLNRVVARPLLMMARIYSDRIVPSLMSECCNMGSPLFALCGVEPYFMGRFALRHAAHRGPLKDQKVEPTLIGKIDLGENEIYFPDQIPPTFNGSDLQLLSEEYAWKPWMRDRCPGSYGPEQLARLLAKEGVASLDDLRKKWTKSI